MNPLTLSPVRAAGNFGTNTISGIALCPLHQSSIIQTSRLTAQQSLMVLLFLMRMSPAWPHSLLTCARRWLNSVCRQMIRTDFWQSPTVSLPFSTVTVSPRQRHERETQWINQYIFLFQQQKTVFQYFFLFTVAFQVCSGSLAKSFQKTKTKNQRVCGTGYKPGRCSKSGFTLLHSYT